jgi:DNA polymerase III delta prime subunit
MKSNKEKTKMFSLDNYFKKIIDKNLLEGSWLFLGLDEEDKFHSVFQIVRRVSDLRDILIIASDKHLDSKICDNFSVLQPSIASVRQAIHFLYLTSSNKKFLLVDHLEDLEFEAQNALLKVTEEPPPNAVLFFLVRNEKRILPTLYSRLKVINIPLPQPKIYFQKQISEEAINFCRDPKRNFHLVKKIFGQGAEEEKKFLEALVILWRDQNFNSLGLQDLKITSLSGDGDWRNLRLALETLRRLNDHNVNPRLQIENMIFQSL